jgi:uncharacterized protein
VSRPHVPLRPLLLPGLVLLLLSAPVIVLLAAGVVWLLQQGWLLIWLVAATSVSALVGGTWRWRRRRRRWRKVAADTQVAVTGEDPDWAPREQAAWQAVLRLSAAADPAALTDRDRLLEIARETVDEVARHYHPDRVDPALEFTLPELLLLTERISARMRSLLLERVPFSDRITVRQLAVAWGYRPAVSSALARGRKAYALLRIARAVSPLNALFAELRDRMLDELYSELNEQVRRRIVRIWIEETGRAAIDLYSGELRVDQASVEQAASAEQLDGVARVAPAPGALRVLVAGRTNAGKSTTINALLGDLVAGIDVLPLTREFEGFELNQSGQPEIVLIDSPGIDDTDGIAVLAERALRCDLIVWVVAAHRADRALDRAALDALREHFAADPRRRMPPLVVAATHIDRLTPAREWQPPYNVDQPTTQKAESMRAAIDAIAEQLGVPVDRIVPVRLDAAPPYNLEALQLSLAAQFDDAQRARWLRVHAALAGRRDWRKPWRQLAGAGRIVRDLVRR